MKSAYEIALEKMEDRGIEVPRTGALDAETRQRMAERRAMAEAALAELEILHRDRMKKLADPAAIEEEKQNYLRERERIEDNRERDLRRLRSGQSA